MSWLLLNNWRFGIFAYQCWQLTPWQTKIELNSLLYLQLLVCSPSPVISWMWMSLWRLEWTRLSSQGYMQYAGYWDTVFINFLANCSKHSAKETSWQWSRVSSFNSPVSHLMLSTKISQGNQMHQYSAFMDSEWLVTSLTISMKWNVGNSFRLTPKIDCCPWLWWILNTSGVLPLWRETSGRHFKCWWLANAPAVFQALKLIFVGCFMMFHATLLPLLVTKL